MHPKLTPKEWALVKAALRRIFSRSDVRKAVIDASIIHGHKDTSRKRVKTWCICSMCGKPEAISYMIVDHIIPILPPDKTVHDMSFDDLVERIWCSVENLQVLDPECHKRKTDEERELKKQANKAKKKELKDVSKNERTKRPTKAGSKRVANK